MQLNLRLQVSWKMPYIKYIQGFGVKICLFTRVKIGMIIICNFYPISNLKKLSKKIFIIFAFSLKNRLESPKNPHLQIVSKMA